MQFKEKTCVLFDLDGTVIDSKGGIFKSIDYTLEKLNLEPTDENMKSRFIGPSIGASMIREYGMDEQQAQQAVDIYREYYSTKGVLDFELYEGIAELIKTLKAQGKKVAIATKKPEHFAKIIIESVDFSDCIDIVTGSSLTELSESKGHIINRAATALTDDMSNVVHIGDTRYDYEGAKEFNIDCIGVLYGYGVAEEFDSGCVIAPTVKDLSKLLLG